MKVAFDEHIPPVLVRVFRTLASEGDVLSAEFVSARDFGVPKAKSDVPWLERFAAAGGRVVISGDKKMRGNLHEQAAHIRAGFITFFFDPRWNNFNPFVKSALLLKWWPEIEKAIKHGKPGRFYEIPFSWNTSELREVTPPKSMRGKPGRKKSAKPITEGSGESARPETAD